MAKTDNNAITVEAIKKLKELSGAGLTDAKKALVEANGDFDKALEAMRKKGLTKAEKRGDRETREGLIESYIHDGRLGAIVEVNCETSFVAKTEEFKTLAHQIAMQIASMAPLYVSEEDIPEEVKKAKVKELEANFKGPENMKDKILEGQVKKAFSDKVLMNQPYILDDTKTVEQFIKESIAKTGENMEELLKNIRDILMDGQIYINRVINYSEAGMIERIRNAGQLLKEEYLPEGIRVEAYVPAELA